MMPSVVVAAPSELAATTGARIADAGGSVVDALIAATLTAMCTEPGVCAPGGGGFLTIWKPGEDPVSVDGYMAMPGKGLDPHRSIQVSTVSMAYGGGITTEVGPGSVAVPGGLAALDGAHSRWGRLSWREVIGYVADVLADGFPLPNACRYYLGYSGESVFSSDPASRSALFEGDRLRDAGETIKVPGLSGTLHRIAEEGADTFYRGDLGREIVADLEQRGSRLTAEDMTSYEAIVGPPIIASISGWTVATTPPPAVGGVSLMTLVRLAAASDDPTDPNNWIAAQRRALELRYERLEPAGDRTAAGWKVLEGLPPTPSASTVSISVAGNDGTVGTATMSSGYGSGVIPTGTGLWMNNSLGEMELNPGGLASVRVGERLMSNMAPTVAAGPDHRMSIGSPGADRITSALGITLTLLLNGFDLPDAIEHPRLHVETARGTVAVEPDLVISPGDLTPRFFDSLDMYFGGVTAAEVSRSSLKGYADSRRTGGVATGRPSPPGGLISQTRSWEAESGS